MPRIRFILIACAATFLVFINSCNNSPQTSTSSSSLEDSSTPVAIEEETVEEAATADKEYMTALGLMKGHLLVGKELLDQDLPDQAEPHMGHPVEELYGDIEAELTERNVDEFRSSLTELHDMVATAPKASEIPTEYKNVMQSIDTAIAALPETKLQSPKFVLDAINGMLATANEEYAAGILDGKIVEIIEYQDSRGFVNYSENLYQTIAEQMQQSYPEQHQSIITSLKELKQAWPSATAPEAVVMTPEQVNQLVEEIQQSSESVSS